MVVTLPDQDGKVRELPLIHSYTVSTWERFSAVLPAPPGHPP